MVESFVVVMHWVKMKLSLYSNVHQTDVMYDEMISSMFHWSSMFRNNMHEEEEWLLQRHLFSSNKIYIHRHQGIVSVGIGNIDKYYTQLRYTRINLTRVQREEVYDENIVKLVVFHRLIEVNIHR